MTETCDEEVGIIPTIKSFIENCCSTFGLTTDVTTSEARDLLAVAPENSVFLNWLLEPFGDFTQKERTEAMSFILGFPLMMKTSSNKGFIVGQRNKGFMSYRRMVKDGIHVPSFFFDGTKRSRFIKLTERMESATNELGEQYLKKDQDSLVLYSVANTRQNRHILQHIVEAADSSQWPVYLTSSDEDLCRTLSDELGFTHRGTKRVEDPLEEGRGFDLYALTRQPKR